MNKNIAKLYQIAQKEEKLIIGLMSGTSLDGLDIALCKIKNNGKDTKIELLNFQTLDYNQEIKDNILNVFAKKNVDLEALCLLHPWIANLHAWMILDCLSEWNISPQDIDIIASHGQTIYHAPQNQHKNLNFPNATLQIGDGDHIAVKTGIITISDFRQKNIAAGGEGAPLAVFGDFLIFSDKVENRIMLNIGGIGNFTYLPARVHREDVFTTDTGPGNTILDQYIRRHFAPLQYDKDATEAQKGTVNVELLAALKNHYFFDLPFPKTTGPEIFNLLYLEVALSKCNLANISHFDILATLTRLSAETIADAISIYIKANNDFVIYMSGGGKHNPLLVRHLKELLPNCKFDDTQSLGINPDAKEAILFALLANECIASENADPLYAPLLHNVTMGKISFPC
jgi:anhydro-N-acetylmuramic acid kinase